MAILAAVADANAGEAPLHRTAGSEARRARSATIGARRRQVAKIGRSFIAFGSLACVVCACASTSPAKAFHNASQLIEARTGHRIFWNQGGPEDEAVTLRVREWLKHELSVDAAVQIALINNRQLQAIYEDLSVAQADLVQAGLLRNPSFSAGMTVPVAGSDVQTGFDFAIAEDFIALLTLSARKNIAKAELDATTFRIADAVLRTTFDVRTAYYALLASQQTLAMRRAVLETGDAAVSLAEAQHAAGNINDLDLVNERSLDEQLRTDVRRSEADALSARETLTRLLGLSGPDASFRVPSKLPEPAGDPPVDGLESIAVSRRLDLAAAHAQTAALSHAAAMARDFRFVGSPSAGVGFERSPERYTAVSPSASIELPVFDQHQADVARLDARVRQARAREAALAVDIRSEVRAARGRLVAMRDVVQRYVTVVVPLREQAVSLSQEQYGSMLLGAYQLLAAKQSEVDAYRELIEALRDYWVARADLERAIAGPIPTGTNDNRDPHPFSEVHP